jgi:hypothetical protein
MPRPDDNDEPRLSEKYGPTLTPRQPRSFPYEMPGNSDEVRSDKNERGISARYKSLPATHGLTPNGHPRGSHSTARWTGQVIRSYRFGTLSTPLSNCRTNPQREQTTTNAVMTEFGTASII